MLMLAMVDPLYSEIEKHGFRLHNIVQSLQRAHLAAFDRIVSRKTAAFHAPCSDIHFEAFSHKVHDLGERLRDLSLHNGENTVARGNKSRPVPFLQSGFCHFKKSCACSQRCRASWKETLQSLFACLPPCLRFGTYRFQQRLQEISSGHQAGSACDRPGKRSDRHCCSRSLFAVLHPEDDIARSRLQRQEFRCRS